MHAAVIRDQRGSSQSGPDLIEIWLVKLNTNPEICLVRELVAGLDGALGGLLFGVAAAQGGEPDEPASFLLTTASERSAYPRSILRTTTGH
jgi:hypothetical protein